MGIHERHEAYTERIANREPAECIHGDDPAQCISCEMLAKRPSKQAHAPKVYEGMRSPDEPNSAGETIVTVNGQVLSPKPSQRLHNHSPDGFNWGYGGSGPAQLALAILLDYFNDPDAALRLYQRFKFRVVAAWPQEKGWKITGAEVADICLDLERDERDQRKARNNATR